MIVILTTGEYSDYGIEDVLEVDSEDAFRAGVEAYKAAGHPYPEVGDSLTSEGQCAGWREQRAWSDGLRDWLLATGVCTHPKTVEIHDDDGEAGWMLEDEA